jgi:hypothetical protein
MKLGHQVRRTLYLRATFHFSSSFMWHIFYIGFFSQCFPNTIVNWELLIIAIIFSMFETISISSQMIVQAELVFACVNSPKLIVCAKFDKSFLSNFCYSYSPLYFIWSIVLFPTQVFILFLIKKYYDYIRNSLEQNFIHQFRLKQNIASC